MFFRALLGALLISRFAAREYDYPVVGGANLAAQNMSSTLLAQKPDLMSIQSSIDDVDARKLTPVTKRNNKILQNLREASLMLDGTSAFHEGLAKNRNFENALRDEYRNKTIAERKRNLADIKAELLVQQGLLRDQASQRIKEHWRGIEDGVLKNFTYRVRQQTIDSIKNVSVGVRELALYRSSVLGKSEKETGAVDEKLKKFLPDHWRALQSLDNKQLFVRDEIKRLQEDKQPMIEKDVSDDVNAVIKQGLGAIRSAGQEWELAKESELKRDFNDSASWMNKALNQTKNSGLGSVSTDISGYLKQVHAIQALANTTEDQALRISKIRESIDEQLGVIKKRKETILQTIQPHVSGLGQRISQAETNATATLGLIRNAYANAEKKVFDMIESRGNQTKKKFKEDLGRLYRDTEGKLMAKLTQAQSSADATARTVTDHIEHMMGEDSPAMENLRKLKTRSLTEATSLADAAKAMVQQHQKFVIGKIGKEVSDTRKAAQNRVDLIRSAADRSFKAYKEGLEKSEEALDEAETKSSIGGDNSTQSAVMQLRDNVFAQKDQFEKAMQPVPSVDQQMGPRIAESSRRLDELQTRLQTTESDLVAFKASLKDRTDKFMKRLQSFPEGALVDSVRSGSEKNFTDAKQHIKDKLDSTVSQVRQDKRFVAQQVDQLSSAVKSGFSKIDAILSQLEKGMSTPISRLRDVSSELLDSVRGDRDRINDNREQIVREFTGNVTADNDNLDRAIGSRMTQLRSNWAEGIQKKISAKQQIGALTQFVNQVQSQLSFSQDANTYTRAVGQIITTLQSIQATMRSGKDSVDTAYATLDRTALQAIFDLNQRITTLAGNSQSTIAGGNAKINAFKAEMNKAVDELVNKTRYSIRDFIKHELDLTENAVSDFLAYVNRTTEDIVSMDTSAGSSVRASNMELRNMTAAIQSEYTAAADVSRSENERNIRIHEALLHNAKGLERSLSELVIHSNETSDEYHLAAVLTQSELIHNLTAVGDWVAKRLSNFNASVLEDQLRVNHTLALRHDATQHEWRKEGHKFQREIQQVIAQLDKTDLFKLLEDVRILEKGLGQVASNAHFGLSAAIGSMNLTTSPSPIRTSHLRELIAKYAEVVSESVQYLPEKTRQESNERERILKETGLNIEQKVASHRFDIFNSKKAMDEVYSVETIDDTIRDVRSEIASDIKNAPKGRDFSAELSEIEKKFKELKESNDQFRKRQSDKVKRWLERRKSMLK